MCANCKFIINLIELGVLAELSLDTFVKSVWAKSLYFRGPRKCCFRFNLVRAVWNTTLEKHFSSDNKTQCGSILPKRYRGYWFKCEQYPVLVTIPSHCKWHYWEKPWMLLTQSVICTSKAGYIRFWYLPGHFPTCVNTKHITHSIFHCPLFFPSTPSSPASLYSPVLSEWWCRANINYLLMKEKLINGHQAGLMVGIMLTCLTVNDPGYLRSCLTFPNPATNRQQPAADSDAWDPLSHIDHPGRVYTHRQNHTNTILPAVYVITLILAAPAFADIGLRLHSYTLEFFPPR